MTAIEHGDGQDDVHVRLRARRRVGEGQARRPEELVLAGDRVDGAHQHLQADVEDALVGHGYPPVVGTVVDHEELAGAESPLVWRDPPRGGGEEGPGGWPTATGPSLGR